jgi:peptide-methionine (R)-S-oxide reductase
VISPARRLRLYVAKVVTGIEKLRSKGVPRVAGAAYNRGMTEPQLRKSEAEWRKQLTPEEYHVLREAGTEPPWSGRYTSTKTKGVYRCRACGAELFRSDTKFDSHCGWPSFWSPLAGDRVVLLEDHTLGMVRTEVRCAACGSHLGHVFHGEGYDTPTDDRYCINSISLTLEPDES